jgi:ankyrin repeat protein
MATNYLHKCAESDMLGQVPGYILPDRLLWLDQNANGETPLHIALRRLRIDDVPPIILRDPEVWAIANEDGITPFMIGLQYYGIEIPEVIRETRELWNARSKAGETPLHVIARRGAIVVVPTPIGCDIRLWRAQDALGNTPMHYALASSKGHYHHILPHIRYCPELLAMQNAEGKKPEDMLA